MLENAGLDMASSVKVSAEGGLSGLSTAPSMSRGVSSVSGASGATINITVNAGMGTDGARIGEQIVNEILRFERTSGKVFARA
jgi:hypothetical protein